MLKEWADMVLFANYETYVVSPDNKMEKKKVSGGKRVMHTTHHACWDAKNRFGLPDKVNFDFGSIAGFIPGTPEYAAAQSPAKETPPAEMHYPENCTVQELKTTLNAADQFNFTLPSDNPMLGSIAPRRSIVDVYKNGDLVFRGTVDGVTKNFDGSRAYTAVGVLALLKDALIKPMQGVTVSAALTAILTKHNSVVGSNACKITLGTVEPTGSVTIGDADKDWMLSAGDALGALLAAKGGYIRLRYAPSAVYLDYLNAHTRNDSQRIDLSNLIDISEQINTDSIVSRVYARGKDGITISSVNSGSDYLVNETVERKYGCVERTYISDKIETPAALKSAAQAYLTRYAAEKNVISLTAVDLSLIDRAVAAFEVGQLVRVVSVPHGIDAEMVIHAVLSDLVQPSNSRVTLGGAQNTLTRAMSGSGSVEAEANSADNAADYVVEQGVSGKWSYRKWNSGIGECWGIFSTDSLAINSAWGSMYYGGWMGTTENKNGRKYPFSFVEAPSVSAAYIGGSGDAWLAADVGKNVNALTHAPAYQLIRPNANTITAPQISYYVIGRWK